ncbi:unnamed protein product [Brachionus calyciflorus]|uniref:Cytochrome b-245 light chain n=1 Tax=Brachionus calyciflorus TaxID=104777 RepID=A0A813NJN7_9BILA|nr:unnamed protein product [Brachionus calyciflorus]
MSSILWSSFANEQAIRTVPILFLGGLMSIIGKYTWWPIGIYSIVIGVLVFVFEYPKSAKPYNSQNVSHNTHSRPYQHILANLYSKFGFLYTDYFPRSLFYFILSIPCLLTLSTILPGLFLLISSGLYLIGFLKKEEWYKIEKKEEIYKRINVLQAPERPPPRNFSQIESD